MADRRGMLPYLVPPPPARGDRFHYLRLRNALPPDSPLHSVLGPLEHGQFVEDAVQGNPLMAAAMALAIPAYTTGKATGLIRGARAHRRRGMKSSKPTRASAAACYPRARTPT